jgi:hypothetical protein
LSRILFSLLLPIAAVTIFSQYLKAGFLDLSPKTELGRETSGMLHEALPMF